MRSINAIFSTGVPSLQKIKMGKGNCILASNFNLQRVILPYQTVIVYACLWMTADFILRLHFQRYESDKL